MEKSFFMPMNPPTVTHHEKCLTVRCGKPVMYDSPQLKNAREKLEAHLVQHVPEKKMTGAIRLMVKWCFPKTPCHNDGEYRVTKPDTDNLQKLLKDCMTHLGFWKDDAQVASEMVEKFWASVPGIYVVVEELENDT